MKTITIKGMGKISVKPDLIVISMKIETENKEYDKTMELASEKIELLNNSLENIGFEKKSVKTTKFNVRTNYESIKTKDEIYKSVFCGYVCNHNLKIEFDFDTKRLSKVISTISKCFAKPELSISFTVKNPSNISRELLISATENAKQKAETLCEASNVKLGELISIDYNWGELNLVSDTDYRIESRLMMKSKASLANVEISPDDINVSDSATFVWEII